MRIAVLPVSYTSWPCREYSLLFFKNYMKFCLITQELNRLNVNSVITRRWNDPISKFISEFTQVSNCLSVAVNDFIIFSVSSFSVWLLFLLRSSDTQVTLDS